MADAAVYDNTAATAAGEVPISEGAAFSFTTSGTASGSLVDVQLELRDSTATTDGGNVTVTLYNNAAGMDQPGAPIANIGTISDAQLNANGTGTLVDIPLAASATLAPATRYWVQLNESNTSGAYINYEADDTGSGVSGESFFFDGEPNSDPNSEGAFIGKVTEEVTCFVAGTMIGTARGDVAVEALVIGDLVVTASATNRPIRWLGHRTIGCRRDERPENVMPVRIAAHAFGEARPARDLFVSPGHAICVDAMGGVLIPAGALVNGTTIIQVEVDTVTYWHVELDTHDIILAENLPAESYLEMGNRGFFAEAGVVALAASPDGHVRTHADFCRPFHDAGPLVKAVRAMIGKIAADTQRAIPARAA